MNNKCLKKTVCIIILTACFTIDTCTLINVNSKWAYSIMSIIVFLHLLSMPVIRVLQKAVSNEILSILY